MLKTITIGEKEIKLKSSAATNILYKKVFGDDVLLRLTEYSKDVKELKKMKADMDAVRADESKTQEEILDAMNEMLNSDVFKRSTTFQSETLPKLAFIMWLEANTETEKIFSKLNEEQYLFWLMTVDQDELLAVTGEVIDLWMKGSRTTSTPKN